MTSTKLTPETAAVGTGVTKNMYSDRQAYTIIDVKRNGKQIVIQRDIAERTNRHEDEFTPGGFVGHTYSPKGQKYEYTQDPNGTITTANWSAKWNRFFVGGAPATGRGTSVTMGRNEHYDYNF